MTETGPAPGVVVPTVDEITFPVEELRAFAHRVFVEAEMQAADAALLVDHLLWAEMRGQTGLGLRKVPQYVARLGAGGTKPWAELVVVSHARSLTVLDAGDTFAQVAGVRALTMAVTRARRSGVGLVLVRNTTSAGALGYYAECAAARRVIGLVINNTPPVMAPWGGRAKDLGSQAFAVGVPTGGPAPLVFDTANSTLSWSRLHDFERLGRQLPSGAVLDASGQPTVDPRAALAGIALPIAGHRGSGLALMWEVLTGVLAGSRQFGPAVGLPDDHARTQGVSLFVLAIDPAMALPYQEFVERVDLLLDRLRSIPPAAGVDRVRVPGERGQALADERRCNGVPLPATLVAALRKLADELGVPGI